MLVKYYGLVFDKESGKWLPRVDFISNGLFRITQPRYLNDKGSEARLLPYFNEFSPADYEWARRECSKIQDDSFYSPSNEELEISFLKPVGDRYGEKFPLILRQEGFQAMEEYDRKALDRIAKKINTFLVEALSCHLGVLSLSKSETNDLMWTHYASEGRGLAVTFNEDHPFFSEFKPKSVSYSLEKRASLTYYKGMMRINGAPVEKFRPDSLKDPKGIMQSILSKGVDIEEFSERLLYAKDEQWSYEKEARIVCSLELCDKKVGGRVKPDFGFKLPEKISHLSHEYSEINLKRIPFDAFRSIIFGCFMENDHKLLIKDLVRKNRDLSDLKLEEVRYDIFGKLEIVDFIE